MRRPSAIAIALLLIMSITACKKENEENLINKQGGPAPCDTTNMKFSINILSILQSNCFSCHGNGQTNGGINLNDYNNIKLQIDNRNLLNAIKHAPGFTPMPQGLPQLSACDLNKITAWINSGASDN